MNMPLEAIPVPLRQQEDGGLRVGKTRVGLESVLHCHAQGDSPEQIVDAFDTLSLADVYAVLAWAKLHPEAVAEYLAMREEQATALRKRLEEAGVTPTPEEAARFKAELLRRWEAKKAQGAVAAKET